MTKRELQYAAAWGAVLMLLTCVPYAIVWWYTPRDAYFPLILFNSDDHGVYFSWMRQAADGNLLFRNLFTTDPQRGVYLHLYFLALGRLSRWSGLDIPTTYHLGRVVFGVVTLALVYRLAAFFTEDGFARRCVFWTTALSAGVGWLFWSDHARPTLPTDVWQPEALTLPSLYTNGLFAVSLALMLGVVLCLLLAETRGVRWAVAAGVCGLLLGNIHSYDVIHLAAAWTGYLAVRWVAERRFPARAAGAAALAALVASPSVAYMAWLYATEPVFRARADTATLSPHPLHYLAGYGLLVPLAIVGVRLCVGSGGARPFAWLPAAWAAAGFAVAYLPVAFQRKMIMGTHFPVALLAGLAVAAMARAAASRSGRPGAAPVVAALLVALLAISNVRFLWRDVKVARTEGVTSTGVHPVYWPARQIRAFEWFGRNTPRDAALLTWPMNGILVPAFSGRAVYAGHWAETPEFRRRVQEAFALYWGLAPDSARRTFLQAHGITHVAFGPLEAVYVDAYARGAASGGRGLPPPRPLARAPWLQKVYQEEDMLLFAVR